ncbi:MAG: ABC transporter ATP-binding protein [Bosea sp.]|uniref:ABC transporter ATP-binding protein n=1 Tax=Bosea sp. (in: a-proteobacteria) TaxID=1871050 RepID=UPI001AC642FB|nr:ABC transporter ATP-binding protein [Bosea sp. (in: a-proteobacteria)]MBN9453325.1 ABC transporter ATP-binding protein [Bosea sp. (in: a-proteobacteria)]
MGECADKLQVRGIAKRYGEIDALLPTDLTISSGEFLTLLGPSGSGKTTLLQMICGLVPPSQGRVIIDGQDQTDTPVHKRDIGLVFQHYALFPHLTVAENIAFPLEMRGLRSADVRTKVNDALELVRLSELGTRFPRELSGGQQQRVALARCFVYQPSVILMDEPLGALDRKLREHLQVEIKQLHRKTGATIIYVTHDQEEALAMSDRICLMNQARVEQVASPRDIYARPETSFAARFIGTSNVLAGKAEGKEQGPSVRCGSRSFGTQAHRFVEGEDVALVVRPEAISLRGEGENRLKGRVIETIFGGADVSVLAEMEEYGTLICRVNATSTTPALGEVVEFSWPSSAAVVVRR